MVARYTFAVTNVAVLALWIEVIGRGWSMALLACLFRTAERESSICQPLTPGF